MPSSMLAQDRGLQNRLGKATYTKIRIKLPCGKCYTGEILKPHRNTGMVPSPKSPSLLSYLEKS